MTGCPTFSSAKWSGCQPRYDGTRSTGATDETQTAVPEERPNWMYVRNLMGRARGARGRRCPSIRQSAFPVVQKGQDFYLKAARPSHPSSLPRTIRVASPTTSLTKATTSTCGIRMAEPGPSEPAHDFQGHRRAHQVRPGKRMTFVLGSGSPTTGCSYKRQRTVAHRGASRGTCSAGIRLPFIGAAANSNCGAAETTPVKADQGKVPRATNTPAS